MSVTVENRTPVHMIFLTGKGLRNKILKYVHKVTGHPACLIVSVFTSYFCFFFASL